MVGWSEEDKVINDKLLTGIRQNVMWICPKITVRLFWVVFNGRIHFFDVIHLFFSKLYFLVKLQMLSLHLFYRVHSLYSHYMRIMCFITLFHCHLEHLFCYESLLFFVRWLNGAHFILFFFEHCIYNLFLFHY